MTKDDLEQAKVLAQQLLEAGLAFEKKAPRRRNYQRMSSHKGGRYTDDSAPLPIYDPDQIRELRLVPTDMLQKQIREMLLARHEEFQARKSRGQTPGQAFYASKEWQRLRYRVLSERGNKCECCGASPEDGAQLHVDHIKPRSRFPELALEKSNLQVLCKPCNMGKSNGYEDDWRKKQRVLVKPN